ncbi:hypothetical protein [Halorhabdus sp. SVX81]|nr:hypothetical protein [Halorhabdus sp. SVX81]
MTQSTTEGSVKVKIDYGGLEDALAERDEFDDLNVNVRSGDIHVRPEGNP